MQKIIKYLLVIFILLNFKVFAKENFFKEAKNLYDKGKIEESKFLFQRNIVFNPKDSKLFLTFPAMPSWVFIYFSLIMGTGASMLILSHVPK